MKLNSSLSIDQRAVLFDKATEPPFSGSLLDMDEAGVYKCANCQAKLFESSHKYDASCGWPSFDKAIGGSIDYHQDTSHGMVRTEVTCAKCGGHLGHVFNDGPAETTSQRYCINSLSMSFDADTKPPTKANS